MAFTMAEKFDFCLTSFFLLIHVEPSVNDLHSSKLQIFDSHN
jgi:hypothetical protein